MTEILKWNDQEFKAGDRLVSLYDYRVITVFDIYASEEGFEGIMVVLEIGEDGSRLMNADEFAYRVDEGHFTRLRGAAYAIGQTFTHHANNDAIEILSVSERQDWNGEYKYFVRLVDETGRVVFTSVDEAYLGRCLHFDREPAAGIALPDIEPGATFPGIIFV